MVTPAFQLWQPIPLDLLKKKRPRHYQKVTFDLAIARTKELFWCVGDFIGVETITGSCAIRLNEVGRDSINLQKVKKVYTPFYRFYMTNTAQVGKTLTLYIGGEASFEIDVTGRVGVTNVAGSDINPATEDTLATLALESGGNLASLAGKDFATQTTLALIKAKTDNLDLAITALRDALLQPATTPATYNVTMTDADTEYSQALPSNCRKFLIHTRDGTAFRLAFVTGKVATPTAPYFSIPISQSYNEDQLNLTGKTLYFGCASAGKVIEIIAWS